MTTGPDMMFCSDDKHPDSLLQGHINQLCARAVAKNIDPFKVLEAACIIPVDHYKLEVGRLRVGDSADFIVLKDLKDFEVIQTWLQGTLVAEGGSTRLAAVPTVPTPNQFKVDLKVPGDFLFKAFPQGDSKYPFAVIEAFDGQLITGKYNVDIQPKNGIWTSDVERDLLQIVVVNRYKKAPVAQAFVRNFGLKTGALASSVAHDSHNIVAVGVDPSSLCMAVNAVIAERGGISAADGQRVECLALTVAGLMSTGEGILVAESYTKLDSLAKQMGSGLQSPFMTLSFMALLVIPHLKLSDLGLFDADRFHLV